MKFKRAYLPVFLLSTVLFSGCGGGGSSSGLGLSDELPTATQGAISGTAAIGAPLAKSSVTILGNGCEKTGLTNINGVFTVNMGDCQGPYLVKIEGGLGTVYSLATEDDVGDIVNASPLTSLVTSLVLGTDDLSSANGASVTTVTPSQISDKVNIVKVIIQPLMSEFGVDSADILKGSFKANGQGLDRVLDSLSVIPSGGDVKIKLKDGTDVTVPTNVSSAQAAVLKNNVSAAVSNITAALTSLDAIQADVTQAINIITSRGSISTYCHSSYLESGYAGNSGCLDFLDESSATFKISRPVILEKVSDDQYWVAFDVFAREQGESDFSIEIAGQVMQVKKNGTSGKWQFYGNQVEYDAEFYPAVMAIGNNASSGGYYVQLHDAVSGSVAYDGKAASVKFLGESLNSGNDLTISGTLDSFGQFVTTDVDNQLCDPSASVSEFSWHCLKGIKAAGSLFKSQFAKVTVTYPDPADPDSSKQATLYVQTPKGMVPEVPTLTLTGTNGSVTACKASISKATWTANTDKLRFDSLDPIWYQSATYYDLGGDGDRAEQGGDFGESEYTFSPALVAFNNSFDASSAYTFGYESRFADIFERKYIRFVTCE